jgi:hypothetical protein
VCGAQARSENSDCCWRRAAAHGAGMAMGGLEWTSIGKSVLAYEVSVASLLLHSPTKLMGTTTDPLRSA